MRMIFKATPHNIRGLLAGKNHLDTSLSVALFAFRNKSRLSRGKFAIEAGMA
jgi:hypothetical protein